MSLVLEERMARGAVPHPDVQTYDEVNRDVLRALETPGKAWWGLLAVAAAGVLLFFGAWGWQVYEGIGVSGLNSPVGWGVYITTFVFWVGNDMLTEAKLDLVKFSKLSTVGCAGASE